MKNLTLKRSLQPFLLIIATLTGLYLLLQPAIPAAAENGVDAPGIADGSSPATAIFAGGCFWCMEKDFEKLDGVFSVVSGYSGGDLENPTYEQVSHKKTGHREAVKVYYDPAVISYRALTSYFFRHIDPFDSKGQFCDKGSSYLSAVFVANETERAIAQEVKAEGEKLLGKMFFTPILPAKPFWAAEAYHQDYYKKSPLSYGYYRAGCGRDARVRQIWGNASAD